MEILALDFYGDFSKWYKAQKRLDMDFERFSFIVGLNGISFLRTVFDNSDNIKKVSSHTYNDAIGFDGGGTEDCSYETDDGTRMYLGVDADTAMGEYSFDFLVSEFSDELVKKIGVAFGKYFGMDFKFSDFEKTPDSEMARLFFYENEEFRDKYINEQSCYLKRQV